ncbi:hypothetical protein HAX54_016191 [Datura stramonium]|uniref:Uncharacterized protein n=1 Tax=Datura stramonium TaxID=4076 RepID=A0ABS8UKC9_DATST|nr:hypothetical protein [Datura stramonium]
MTIILRDEDAGRVFRNVGRVLSSGLGQMTPRRPFRSRTSKQSGPKDKGKEKEKRPIEAESDSNSEFEEALRKMKEDEERRDELCHKRGEDDLRFNDVPRMKEKFFEGTQNRNFNEEKQFSLNRIEQDFPDILRQIEEKD